MTATRETPIRSTRVLRRRVADRVRRDASARCPAQWLSIAVKKKRESFSVLPLAQRRDQILAALCGVAGAGHQHKGRHEPIPSALVSARYLLVTCASWSCRWVAPVAYISRLAATTAAVWVRRRCSYRHKPRSGSRASSSASTRASTARQPGSATRAAYRRTTAPPDRPIVGAMRRQPSTDYCAWLTDDM
jgi:hypothetical protein